MEPRQRQNQGGMEFIEITTALNGEGYVFRDGRIDSFVRDRYASYDIGIGKKIKDGSATLAKPEQYALSMSDVTTNISGRQEYLEHVMNQIIFDI